MVKRIAQGFLYIVERIACTIICVITFLACTDNGDAQRIQSCIDNLLHSLRESGVGVHIDLTARRYGTDSSNALCDAVGCKRRLSLTSLSETDNAVRCNREMVDTDLGDFLCSRGECNPLLRRGTALRTLKGDTAETIRIAHGRCRNTALPTPIKEILSSQAVIVY